MLFEGLNKLKQQSIMTTIMLIAGGFILILWPGEHSITLMKLISCILLIVAMVMILNYTRSKKSVMDYVKLSGALVIGIIGMWIMIFDVNTLDAVSWVFGLLLIVDGFNSGFHALIYSRRSHRKGWWVLLPLAVLLIVFGILAICHPWWNDAASLLHAIGWMTVCAAAISALRLIWVWPLKGE